MPSRASLWKEIKDTLKNRPLLFYIIGVPLDKVSLYLQKAPEDEELIRIKEIIDKDRTAKTEPQRQKELDKH